MPADAFQSDVLAMDGSLEKEEYLSQLSVRQLREFCGDPALLKAVGDHVLQVYGSPDVHKTLCRVRDRVLQRNRSRRQRERRELGIVLRPASDSVCRGEGLKVSGWGRQAAALRNVRDGWYEREAHDDVGVFLL
jgi:hypothetical protein